MTINTEKVAPLAHHYLPEHLKRKPLYVEVCELLDYLTYKCYEPHVINMRDKLNPLGTGFDPNEFLTFIDGFKYKDLIFKDVDIRTVATLLPRIYTLKGTKKGLKMILNILGIKADVYIWWELLRKLDVDAEYTEDFKRKFGDIRKEELEECSIYLNLLDSGSTFSKINLDIDEQLKELCSAFLWVCASINVINIFRQFVERLNLNDRFTHNQEYDSVSTRYDSYSLRFGLANHLRNSDVIYNSLHRHNETGLKYHYGTSMASDTNHAYYPYDIDSWHWTFAGSILDYYEDYSFRETLPFRRVSLNHSDETHYFRDRIPIRDRHELSIKQDDEFSLELNDRLTDNNAIPILERVGEQDLSIAYHNYKHKYRGKRDPNLPDFNYGSPLREHFTLSDSIAYTIEED